jgi:hypothetical protein
MVKLNIPSIHYNDQQRMLKRNKEKEVAIDRQLGKDSISWD